MLNSLKTTQSLTLTPEFQSFRQNGRIEGSRSVHFGAKHTNAADNVKASRQAMDQVVLMDQNAQAGDLDSRPQHLFLQHPNRADLKTAIRYEGNSREGSLEMVGYKDGKAVHGTYLEFHPDGVDSLRLLMDDQGRPHTQAHHHLDATSQAASFIEAKGESAGWEIGYGPLFSKTSAVRDLTDCLAVF